MNGIYLFFIFLMIQRGVELYIARQNERKMKQMGAIEVGKKHYSLFIILHSIFFISLILETWMKQTHFIDQFTVLLWGLFVATQLFRIWCIQSLGMYWNTKIIILPRSKRIKKGPYMWMDHPNYIIVFIELLIIPLIVQAYVTAIVFPLLHFLILCIRIPVENEALKQLQN